MANRRKDVKISYQDYEKVKQLADEYKAPISVIISNLLNQKLLKFNHKICEVRPRSGTYLTCKKAFWEFRKKKLNETQLKYFTTRQQEFYDTHQRELALFKIKYDKEKKERNRLLKAGQNKRYRLKKGSEK